MCTNCGDQHVAVNGSCKPCNPGCTWDGQPAGTLGSWGSGQQYPVACKADGTCIACASGYGRVGTACEKVRGGADRLRWAVVLEHGGWGHPLLLSKPSVHQS